MRILLDTAVLLWMAEAPENLSPPARAALTCGEHEIWVHQASLWELQIKASLGRLQLDPTPRAWVERARVELRLEYARVEDDAIAMLERLPALHGDPFDRLLLAHALAYGLTLVSSDRQIHRYPVPVIW